MGSFQIFLHKSIENSSCPPYISVWLTHRVLRNEFKNGRSCQIHCGDIDFILSNHLLIIRQVFITNDWSGLPSSVIYPELIALIAGKHFSKQFCLSIYHVNPSMDCKTCLHFTSVPPLHILNFSPFL